MTEDIRDRKNKKALKPTTAGDCTTLRGALNRLAVEAEIFIRTHSGPSYADIVEALDKIRSALTTTSIQNTQKDS